MCFTVRSDSITPDMTLNTYLRERSGLTGTKWMCWEGGCGACVVAATFRRASDQRLRTVAVNSCLVPILACHDWHVTTVEGLGSRRSGKPHAVQRALAEHGATQCGYCSPGMVMNMYSLLTDGPKPLTAADLERSFGGSLCRCTGYRPIIEAFRYVVLASLTRDLSHS